MHLGTYTGHYEPVKEMSDLLDEYEAKTGHSVPIHGKLLWYLLTHTLRFFKWTGLLGHSLLHSLR